MDTILFKGTEYKPVFNNYPGKEARVFLKEDSFIIYVNNSWDEKRKAAELKKALEKWYMKQAADGITKSLEYYSGIIGVKYNNVRIKDQKTRWGSCSQKGNVNFNWRLVMASEWVLDYVVIHELCHRKHMNHSKEFWKLVELYCPDYKKAKQWLRINGYKLIKDIDIFKEG